MSEAAAWIAYWDAFQPFRVALGPKPVLRAVRVPVRATRRDPQLRDAQRHATVVEFTERSQ